MEENTDQDGLAALSESVIELFQTMQDFFGAPPEDVNVVYDRVLDDFDQGVFFGFFGAEKDILQFAQYSGLAFAVITRKTMPRAHEEDGWWFLGVVAPVHDLIRIFVTVEGTIATPHTSFNLPKKNLMLPIAVPVPKDDDYEFSILNKGDHTELRVYPVRADVSTLN